MPKKLRDRLEKKTGRHASQVVNRWRFEKRGDRYEVDVFNEARGKWALVAVVMGTTEIPAEALAGYVVQVLNEKQEHGVVLDEAVQALQSVLDEGVTYATEMEAEHAIRRLKQQGAVLQQLLQVLDMVVAQGITATTKREAQRTLADLKDYKIAADHF
jgi:hypothetical protein